MAIGNPLIKNIPIANPTTKEILQDQLPITTDTGYTTQRTKMPYNELVIYSFEPTNEGTFTQTVTADFVLTSVNAAIEQRSNTKTHTLYLNDVAVYMITTAADFPASIKIDLPSVLVRKDSVFRLECVEDGGLTTLQCVHSLIGYAV